MISMEQQRNGVPYCRQERTTMCGLKLQMKILLQIAGTYLIRGFQTTVCIALPLTMIICS